MSLDYKAFDLLKEANPKRYRNMKWTLRINSPMVILLMLFMMFATLMDFDPNDFPVWKFALFQTTYLLLCLVSVRWFIWSLKKE